MKWPKLGAPAGPEYLRYEEACMAQSPANGWLCCRRVEHNGPHIATSDVVLAVWDKSKTKELTTGHRNTWNF
jgi:hypothetical protein